LNLNFL
jgi:chromosome segregation ATPase